jgi:uncharacterized DUF497 family protein
MTIRHIFIRATVLDKLQWKHDITEAEVREVFRNKPLILKAERGDVPGEDLYSALGQTDAGRYIVIYYVQKLSKDALVISARNMNEAEKKRYGKKK